MSEETTGEPGAADTAPGTEAVSPPHEGGSAPAKRATFEVPKWVAVALAGLLLLGVGFGIGWVAAPGGGHHERDVSERRGLPGAPNGRGLPGRGLPNPGAVSGVFLGVATQDAAGGASGAQITNVVAGSPADQAGLKTGDVVTAVDGSPVTSAAQLAARIRAHQPGDQVTLTYTRSGASAQATVKLGTRSTPGTPSA